MFMSMPCVCTRAAMQVTLIFAVASNAAMAQDAVPANDGDRLNLALVAGGTWSDNIGRETANEDNGTLVQTGLLLDYKEQTRRFDASVDANAAYEHYSDNTFDDDVIGGVAGALEFRVAPERFNWIVQENFGQITTDPFAADTPDNRENVNFFTTGPDLTFRFGNALSLLLGGRYSISSYEESELDGDRYSETLALIRRLSSASALSLNATADQIKFDNTAVNENYDRYLGFLRYDNKGSRTALAVDLGYTAIDNGEETSDGVLARVSLVRRVSASSTLAFGAATQFSDASDLFRDSQNQQGVELSGESVVGSSDPFESRLVSLNWNFERNRTSFGVGVQYSEEDYENIATNDRTLTTYNVSFGRKLSPTVAVRLLGTYEREHFERVDFDDDELRANASISKNLGRTLQVRLQYSLNDRDSSSVGTKYKENRVSLFVSWSPIGSP